MSGAFEWPDGRAGAVSLTFDDGHPSQLDAAIPVMNNLDMAGTFYVNPPANYVEWLKPWREAHGQGHEIGNHTVQHICSRNFGFRADGGGLETVTLETIEADILDAQARLREGIPEQTDCTFCYPCAQTFVGEGESRQRLCSGCGAPFHRGARNRRMGEPSRPVRPALPLLVRLQANVRR